MEEELQLTGRSLVTFCYAAKVSRLSTCSRQQVLDMAKCRDAES